MDNPMATKKSAKIFLWVFLLSNCLNFTQLNVASAWTSTSPQVAVSVFGGTSSDGGSSMAVDSSGNVYTTGIFQGTADFDPGSGTANLSARGGLDVFVVKFDASGNYVWANQYGGSESEGSAWARQNGYLYAECSAKSGDNVQEVSTWK